MIIHFNKYTYGYKIVSLARDKETSDYFSSNNMEHILLSDNGFELYPDKIYLSISEKSKDKLQYCNNFDVFEISAEGKAYQFYNNMSIDNVFVITEKCNSSCIMCPYPEKQRKNSTIYNVNNLIKIASHIPNDAAHLTITGGEPFMLKEDIFLFLDFLKKKFTNTEVLLLTNGRIFSSAHYCNLLKKTSSGKMILGIPLHGYNSQTNDYITQTKGSFIQTFKGIKNLLNLGIKVELRIVVNKITIKYMDKFADMIVREFPNIFSVKIMAMEMLGCAAANRNRLWIDYSKAFSYTRAITDKLIDYGIDVSYYNFPLCTVDKKYHLLCRKSIDKYKAKFLPQCEQCVLYDSCGGIFAGTLNYEKDDIVPIKEE